jgi:hypothetical protein
MPAKKHQIKQDDKHGLSIRMSDRQGFFCVREGDFYYSALLEIHGTGKVETWWYSTSSMFLQDLPALPDLYQEVSGSAWYRIHFS